MPDPALPIDAALPELTAALHAGNAVLVAPPGAGKTAFVERLVAGCRHWVFPSAADATPRCWPRQACPARHPELRRHRAAGRKRGPAVQTGSRTPIGEPARALRTACLER